uniref:Uncharacterized protein n=1 Tax=Anguilla anguilla TaxID=7936 RepID=A0A0E9PSW6_ANGAN
MATPALSAHHSELTGAVLKGHFTYSIPALTHCLLKYHLGVK